VGLNTLQGNDAYHHRVEGEEKIYMSEESLKIFEPQLGDFVEYSIHLAKYLGDVEKAIRFARKNYSSCKGACS
jgi:hypothetical protein